MKIIRQSATQEVSVLDHAPYALGHHQHELQRLIDQARYNGELTAQILSYAGLARGMHVLDIGCGAGDTSFLAASIVGPQGSVTGVDRSPQAVALGSERAAQAALANLHFVTADLADYQPQGRFDALIGSRILMYFPDPAVTLRRLLTFVRPGGIVAFHELDLKGMKGEPSTPLLELAFERLRQTFVRTGADLCAGLKLAQIYEDAGLPTPQMIMGARVEKAAGAEAYRQLAGVTRSLLPYMERTGVASAAEVEIDTLAERLTAEGVAANATVVAPPMIGAWTRKPLY